CLAATSGTVRINGYDIYEESYRAKRYLGYLPEIPPVYLEMTPTEYLRFVGEAKGIKKAELNGQIASAINRTGISEVKDRLIKNLSKGYRQRVGLSQAIIGHPETIILDEPTVGLDPRQIIEIRELIRSLAKDHTVILSSHILFEVSAVCDLILIIANGKLVASDATEELLAKFDNQNSLSLTVRGTPAKIRAALKGVSGIAKLKTTDPDEDGLVNVSINTAQGTDIRDKVSKALINSDCLILSMTRSALSLEDIFLRLTNENSGAKNKKRKRPAETKKADNDTGKRRSSEKEMVTEPLEDLASAESAEGHTGGGLKE
ncbi:MAG: ABC transporter ATP-binding protein, partial [Oscillospiraceae bacterium]|nr:ABC transporter ATP-binding protein [Oscillospiraceae bacterium]